MTTLTLTSLRSLFTARASERTACAWCWDEKANVAAYAICDETVEGPDGHLYCTRECSTEVVLVCSKCRHENERDYLKRFHTPCRCRS